MIHNIFAGRINAQCQCRQCSCGEVYPQNVNRQQRGVPVKDGRHKQGRDFRNVSHQMQVTPSAQSDTILYQRACELFEELWDGTPIRLLGIRASRLEEESAPQQMNLFDYLEEVRETKNERKQDQKHRKLDRALDEIRKKFGDDAVMRAAFLKKQEKKEEKDPQDQG